MQFLVSTTAEVTLEDLGNRVISNSTTDLDLGLEYDILELRNSESLAQAIFDGNLTAEDALGKSISALGTLDLTKEELTFAGIPRDSDDLPEGSTNKYLSQSSLQTELGNVSTDDLPEGSTNLYFNGKDTDDLTEGSTNLYYTDARSRQAISIAIGSTDFLGYNNTTGELSIKSLGITDVTVDTTETSLANWISSNYTTGNELQEGDTLILTGTSSTEVYIHNGGTAGTAADFTQIQSNVVDDAYIRGLFSATGPLNYNSGTGAFTIDQANGSTDGFLSSTDWNTFNNKQATISAGDGIDITTNIVSIDLSTNSGLTFDTGSLTIDSSIAGSGLTITNGVLSVDDINLASAVTGILGTANGGTGLDATSATNGQLLIGSSTGSFSLSTITQGSGLTISNGAGTIEIGVDTDGIDETLIDFGSGANQVDATSLPLDTGGSYAGSASNVQDALEEVESQAAKTSFVYSFATDSNNVTNRFLNTIDGLSSNDAPFVSFYASTIKAISLSQGDTDNWTAEVYINGSLSTATLASGGSSTAFDNTLNVSVSAGDTISIYCDGNGVKNPVVSILLEQN